MDKSKTYDEKRQNLVNETNTKDEFDPELMEDGEEIMDKTIVYEKQNTHYALRWYICIIFCLFCIMQASTFNMYGQISTPVKLVYRWSDFFIEWLLNSNNFSFALFTIPVALVVERFGVRLSMIFGVVVLNVCTILRLFWEFSFVGEHALNIINFCNDIKRNCCYNRRLCSSSYFNDLVSNT